MVAQDMEQQEHSDTDDESVNGTTSLKTEVW